MSFNMSDYIADKVIEENNRFFLDETLRSTKIDKMKIEIAELKELLDLQRKSCTNRYLRGFHDGMELARSILENNEPHYIGRYDNKEEKENGNSEK